MSSIIEQDFPYDILHRGRHDEHRHARRVDEAARKQLKDIISQQDIITSEGNKKVKVKLKYLDQFRFLHNRDRVDEVGRDEFDELESGEIISRPMEGDASNKPGDAVGEEVYEAEYTLDQLTDMMIEELNLPDLDETKKNEIITEVEEWTDRRKGAGIHALLDKRKTLLANILRRAKLKKSKPLPVINDDLRFRTWNLEQERHSNAAIFLMMDRSGSMYEDKIFAVKAFYFWVVQFLKRKYDKVEIRFIAHDVVARELKEKDFFSISDSGGTYISSAYKLCREIVKRDYSSSEWNIYCFHASDGDSFGDEKECVKIIEDILRLGATLFGYIEVDMDSYSGGSNSELYLKLHAKSKSRRDILTAVIRESGDVLDALKIFLRKTLKTNG